MRNEPWVWPEVRDAGTSGAGAVPLRSAQLMGQQKKKKKKKKKKKTSNDRAIIYLVRKLVITCLRFNILFQAQHIAGEANVLADHLSRLQVSAFLAKAPSASRQPEAVPPLPHLPV